MNAPPRFVFTNARTIAMAVVIALSAVALLFFLYVAQRVLIWIMIALFLALALERVTRLLERWLPRTQAAIATFAAMLVAAAGIGYLLVPPLIGQVHSFVESVPDLLQELSNGRGPLGFLEREFGIVERARRLLEEGGLRQALGLTGPVLSVISSVLTGIIGAFSVLFLTLFMLVRGPAWYEALLGALPERHRPLAERVGEGLFRAIGGWVLGAALLASLAGATSAAVLLVLGAPYPAALAVIVAVLDPVPFVGATIAAAIVSMALLATEGLVAALVFVGFVVVYQAVVENQILVPLVYGQTVELDPLGVLIAVLIGGELAGIVGAIAAIPIGGSLIVVTREVRAWRADPGRRAPQASS